MKPDFYLIPTIVRESKGLRPSDWFVYATVYWFEHMQGHSCFASNAAIAKASGMGQRTVGRALENLESAGFIERSYKDKEKTIRSQIHATVMFAKTESLFKDSPNGPGGGRPKWARGVSPGGPQSNNKGIVNTISAPSAEESMQDKNINDFIGQFKKINPSYGQLFKRKNQREAAARLLKMKTWDVWLQFFAVYSIQIQRDTYCPTATTPMELESKLGKIAAYITKLKVKGATEKKTAASRLVD